MQTSIASLRGSDPRQSGLARRPDRQDGQLAVSREGREWLSAFVTRAKHTFEDIPATLRIFVYRNEGTTWMAIDVDSPTDPRCTLNVTIGITGDHCWLPSPTATQCDIEVVGTLDAWQILQTLCGALYEQSAKGLCLVPEGPAQQSNSTPRFDRGVEVWDDAEEDGMVHASDACRRWILHTADFLSGFVSVNPVARIVCECVDGMTAVRVCFASVDGREQPRVTLWLTGNRVVLETITQLDIHVAVHGLMDAWSIISALCYRLHHRDTVGGRLLVINSAA